MVKSQVCLKWRVPLKRLGEVCVRSTGIGLACVLVIRSSGSMTDVVGRCRWRGMAIGEGRWNGEHGCGLSSGNGLRFGYMRCGRIFLV